MKRVELPRWFVKDDNQAAAEFIAFNVAIDRLVGLEPSADRWPYNAFRRATVEAFLQRLARETTMEINTPWKPSTKPSSSGAA